MLSEFLQKAISLNADRLEIEYKDGEEWVTAFCGDMGLGIGSVDSTKRDKLFEELGATQEVEAGNADGQCVPLDILRIRELWRDGL